MLDWQHERTGRSELITAGKDTPLTAIESGLAPSARLANG
jgi:hypothetical protein